jgi:plasmid stabilization system protein ParE
MQIYQVISTAPADQDLEDIIEYISSEDSAYKALSFAQELLEVIQKNLSIFPKKYKQYKDFRLFPYKDSLIFFDIKEENKAVEVLAITHSSQYLRYENLIH